MKVKIISILFIVQLLFSEPALGGVMKILKLNKVELSGLKLSLKKIEELGLENEFYLQVHRFDKKIIYTFTEVDSPPVGDVRGNASGKLALEFTYTPENGELVYSHVR